MKALLKILAGGLVAFQLLAISDEWSFFSTAWLGDGQERIELAPADRRQAVEALRLTLTLMGHLYESGGDTRFAERMPAAPEVVEEMLADVAYLRHNHRRQVVTLESFQVQAVEPLGQTERLEVRTRERWQVRTQWLDGSGDSDPPRSQEGHARYLLVRQGAGWQVTGWDLAEPGAGDREMGDPEMGDPEMGGSGAGIPAREEGPG